MVRSTDGANGILLELLFASSFIADTWLWIWFSLSDETFCMLDIILDVMFKISVGHHSLLFASYFANGRSVV